VTVFQVLKALLACTDSSFASALTILVFL